MASTILCTWFIGRMGTAENELRVESHNLSFIIWVHVPNLYHVLFVDFIFPIRLQPFHEQFRVKIWILCISLYMTTIIWFRIIPKYRIQSFGIIFFRTKYMYIIQLYVQMPLVNKTYISYGAYLPLPFIGIILLCKHVYNVHFDRNRSVYIYSKQTKSILFLKIKKKNVLNKKIIINRHFTYSIYYDVVFSQRVTSHIYNIQSNFLSNNGYTVVRVFFFYIFIFFVRRKFIRVCRYVKIGVFRISLTDRNIAIFFMDPELQDC